MPQWVNYRIETEVKVRVICEDKPLTEFTTRGESKASSNLGIPLPEAVHNAALVAADRARVIAEAVKTIEKERLSRNGN